jgi:hypothetical protein
MNRHNDVIDRSILTQGEIPEIEEKLGRKLNTFTFDEILAAYNKRHNLAEGVSVSSTLLAAKVMSTVIEGAMFYGDKWKKLVNLHMLTEEQEKIPIMTESDFEYQKGSGEPPLDSGGEVAEISFDVSADSTDRYMWVQFRKKTSDRKKFDLMQNAIMRASAKFAKGILDEVVEFAVANAGTTVALGGSDRFTKTTELVATMEEAGFPVSAAAMTPTDFSQVLTTQIGTAGPLPFITNTMLDKSGNAIRGLEAGEDYMLLGYIPGIKAVNSTLAGDILLTAPQSLNMGQYGDIKIENWEDFLKGYKGFKISTTLELKTHSKLSAGIGLVTGV